MEEKVVVKKPPKSPAFAGILTFFLPFGTGALYNGQIRKAIVFFFSFAFLVTLQTTGENQPFLGLCLAGFYFYQIYDAIQSAKVINRKAMKLGEEAIEAVEEIPEIVKSGSIFWGGFLMLLGGVFLLANFDVIDYYTVWEFWPVAVIAIGVKLIVEYYVREKKTS